tara:strand:+ start:2164 stop:2463 length:300 start_codon:yes stop_codon:yes gene_type:complete
MKTINTKTELLNFKGDPIKNGPDDTLKVGVVLSTILGGKVSNPTLGWTLGKKFATEDEVDLKAEDVVFLKKELENNGKSEQGFTAVVTGQIIEMLDSKS